jgi:hypothetical protein
VSAPNASIAVNRAASPVAKVATYEYTNASGAVVQNEAVTLTDSDGNELLGQKTAAQSVPVTLASDQPPIPVTTEPPASTGALIAIPAANVATAILPADSTRLGFSVFNQSPTDTLYLLLSNVGTVSQTYCTVPLQPNAYYEVPFNYTGPVSGIWGSVAPGAQALVNVYTH